MALVLLAGGCTPTAGRDSAVGDTAAAGQPAAPCEVPLRTVSYGDTDRYFVDVTIDGAVETWQLDTGSGITFRYEGTSAPAYTPDLGMLDAGCGALGFAGRALVGGHPGPDGATVSGLLGMDFLLRAGVVLDIERLVVAHHEAPPAWPDAVRVPFDDVQSHALVPLALDGESVRLLFDTGGGHTLWVGQDGQPGDAVEQVQDAQGTIFSIYVGSGLLELGAIRREIPVARAPEFPYFQDTVDALGGDIHGLLGVTAFPGEALRFDQELGELWIRPAAD